MMETMIYLHIENKQASKNSAMTPAGCQCVHLLVAV